MHQKNDHHNRGGLIAFGFSMVFVFAFFIYLVAVNKGVDLGENIKDPNFQTKVEEFKIEKVAEPWIASEPLVTYGYSVFKANCAICHGDNGQGDGPGGAALNPKPRNFVEGVWTKGQGIIDHFKVITNGIEGTPMAAFGHLSVGDRWAMLHYIESITKNKSKDTPAQVVEFAKSAK